jgi:hypothetical protein
MATTILDGGANGGPVQHFTDVVAGVTEHAEVNDAGASLAFPLPASLSGMVRSSSFFGALLDNPILELPSPAMV